MLNLSDIVRQIRYLCERCPFPIAIRVDPLMPPGTTFPPPGLWHKNPDRLIIATDVYDVLLTAIHEDQNSGVRHV